MQTESLIDTRFFSTLPSPALSLIQLICCNGGSVNQCNKKVIAIAPNIYFFSLLQTLRSDYASAAAAIDCRLVLTMPIDPQFFQHLPPYVAALVESIGNSPKGALTCDGQSIALQCPNIGFLNEVRNFVDDLQVAAALVGYEFRLDYLNSGN